MPRYSANLTFLFSNISFLDRFEAAARYNFDGVEFMFPYTYPKEQLQEILHKYRLTHVLHNLPAGNWDGGDRGIACHPDRTAEFQEGVERATDYAAALGNTQVNCLVGILPPNVPLSKAHDTCVMNIKHAAQRLAQHGLKLLVEAINTYDIPNFYLSTTAQVTEVIREANEPNVFLQYDAYHMQMMEGNIANTISANLEKIAHIQIADVPGRHEPGTGEINYGFLLPWLDEIGYRGWVGCEYKPKAATETGLSWRTELVSNLCHKTGSQL